MTRVARTNINKSASNAITQKYKFEKESSVDRERKNDKKNYEKKKERTTLVQEI